MRKVILIVVAMTLTAVSIGCKASAEVGDSTNITAPR